MQRKRRFPLPLLFGIRGYYYLGTAGRLLNPAEDVFADHPWSEGPGAAVDLHFTHYNFVRFHKTLRCTPAMEAGITNRLWTVRDIAALLERDELGWRAA